MVAADRTTLPLISRMLTLVIRVFRTKKTLMKLYGRQNDCYGSYPARMHKYELIGLFNYYC